ncbi:MAG: isoprenylcysteine carboxylmethyltransferase family protein [Rhodoferax sp.]|nr:MAG: isoprenylcysteine carboxylmethyltransferase family protein [Rhodoferax sp.]
MHWLEHKIPPPVVGLLCALAMWAAAPAVEWSGLSWLHWALGVAGVGTGLGFDVLGLLAFRRAKTTINPLSPGKASSLVASGVYRVTRNPMYLGMALVLCGWAVLLAYLPAALGPVVFVVFITRFQIVPEERFMAAKFGDDYNHFCQQVRRWL